MNNPRCSCEMEDLHAAHSAAAACLHLLQEAATLPGRRPLKRVVVSFAEAYRKHLEAGFRMPVASLLPDLIAETFRTDLQLERERERYRVAMGQKAPPRFVRGEWARLVRDLKSLTDEEKQHLAARLRGGAALEAKQDATGPGAGGGEIVAAGAGAEFLGAGRTASRAAAGGAGATQASGAVGATTVVGGGVVDVATSLLPLPAGYTSSLSVVTTALEMPETIVGDFREEFAKVFLDAMNGAADDAVAHLDLGASWNLKNERAVENMRQYSGWYGDRLSKVVPLDQQVQLRKVLVRGLDEGLSIPQMRDAMTEQIDGLKGYQAERIAITEAVRAREEARRIVHEEAGVQREVWVVADAPCDICDPLAGQVFNIDEGPRPPLHSNCKCGRDPAPDDLDRIRREAMAGIEDVGALPEPAAPRYRQTPRG
jgi:SPP1 gp7 family putative phage head morphogenesis protein